MAHGQEMCYNNGVTRGVSAVSNLPRDPMILYSVLNMKLRDFYGSLDALCDDLDEDKQALLDAMAKAGFRYDPERNAFV